MGLNKRKNKDFLTIKDEVNSDTIIKFVNNKMVTLKKKYKIVSTIFSVLIRFQMIIRIMIYTILDNRIKVFYNILLYKNLTTGANL